MAATGALIVTRLFNATTTILLMLLIAPVLAQPGSEAVLDEKAYRQPLEEVVVTGKAPAWRKPAVQEWRPQIFELPDSELTPRMQWFPPYRLDERDNLTTVNNRMDEKAGLKILELRF